MNVKNLVLGVGIFIVYLLVLNYGIQTFYPSPQYSDFCSGDMYKSYPYLPETKNCTFSQSNQNLIDNCTAGGGYPNYAYDSQGCQIFKDCNFCQKHFQDAQKEYDKVVFLVSLIVGVITLFIGYGILSIEPVGSALMASGVGAIIYGAARNWANLTNIWRFLLLLASLILLIWIALRLNRRK